ncbi:MAG TPA: SUF system Fe-S cluster assembly protein [Rhodospirillaceae bacterium]|nr:SUF system Fe-S cluster assembly protein [Rhodospirillaceae bacterium]
MNMVSSSDAAIVATAGEALEQGLEPATDFEVVQALKDVYDPEIPVNIYDLGLIYGLKVGERGDVKLDMTLTAPSCPVAGALPQQVAEAVAAVSGIGTVEVALVWEPPWTMDKMSDDARLMLNLY